METKNSDEIRQAVRSRYGEIAKQEASGCGCSALSSCCGTTPASIEKMSQAFGYTKEQLNSAPEGANMGLGCGNPQAIASLKQGDMVSKARKNAEKLVAKNVEFRLGEIENLPVADASVDVIISNCVINLSPEKMNVFREAWRVLKPGGRLAILDIVALQTLPAKIKNDISLISGCVGGTEKIEVIEKALQDAGFQDININPKDESRESIREWFPGRNLEDYVTSATIEAKKPF